MIYLIYTLNYNLQFTIYSLNHKHFIQNKSLYQSIPTDILYYRKSKE